MSLAFLRFGVDFMDVEIRENGEYLTVKTPYLPLFVDEIKKLIPKPDRFFKDGAWWVKNTLVFVDDKLLTRIAEFSPELKRKIFLEFL